MIEWKRKVTYQESHPLSSWSNLKTSAGSFSHPQSRVIAPTRSLNTEDDMPGAGSVSDENEIDEDEDDDEDGDLCDPDE
jgi:hypothetical protein